MSAYAAAVTALYGLGHELAMPAKRFDLENTRVVAAALGHPERRYPSVLVAGTNGKGSTSATLMAIARAAGYRTGLYTSPHLVRINERIQVDGEPISDPEFAEIYKRIQEVATPVLGGLPSFFETLTLMALEYFAAVDVDLAVLEVGMGGRLDATNIVDPCLSVITDIALDHQQYLGDTIAAITREKAGILRRKGVMVTLPQHPEANEALGRAAMELEVRGVSAVKHMPNVSPGAVKFDALRPTAQQIGAFLRGRYFLAVMGEEIFLETPLIGRHQVRNLALAITAAEELNQHGFRITAQNVAAGVRDTVWPGRFHFFAGHGGRADLILDVAHNPAGAWALRAALSENFADRAPVLVFGAMRDKAVGEMAEILFPIATRVIVTHADTPRAATPVEIQASTPLAAGAEAAPDTAAALRQAFAGAGPRGLVVVTGSIYLVGEALAALEL